MVYLIRFSKCVRYLSPQLPIIYMLTPLRNKWSNTFSLSIRTFYMKFAWIITLQIIIPPNFFRKFFSPLSYVKVEKVGAIFIVLLHKSPANLFPLVIDLHAMIYAKRKYFRSFHWLECVCVCIRFVEREQEKSGSNKKKVMRLICTKPLLIRRPWHIGWYKSKKNWISLYLNHFYFLPEFTAWIGKKSLFSS